MFNLDNLASKPKETRINYSICNSPSRVYLYGGISQNNQVLSTMESFDATTYQFAEMTYRGEGFKPKGRQGHAAMILDQFTMLVIGGTYSEKFIDPMPVPADDIVLSFDTETCTWTNRSSSAQAPGNSLVSEAAPWNLVYHSIFRLDAQNIGVIWYDIVIKNDN